uniref:TIGR01244 family sulfur transferase n=1 Tax=Sphingomonas sp. TaxID=28214 RepID=UPI00286B242C
PMLRVLDDKTLVSGQIMPADVAEFQRQGVTMIVNNRPDFEDEDQPLSREIEAAAELAGVEFRFIPIVRGIGPADVDAMHQAMRDCGDGKMLAFCRSGTRSTLAWAVARAREGVAREELEAGAAKAGVDLNPVAHLL